MTHLNTEPETEETSSVPKIDTGTIARTTTLIISLVLAALAGVNQYLSAHGRSPLTVDETTITSIVTYLVTVGTALWAWWKPNNFTERARQKYKLAEVIQQDMLIDEARKKYIESQQTKPQIADIKNPQPVGTTDTGKTDEIPSASEETPSDEDKQKRVDTAIAALKEAIAALN